MEMLKIFPRLIKANPLKVNNLQQERQFYFSIMHLSKEILFFQVIHQLHRHEPGLRYEVAQPGLRLI